MFVSHIYRLVLTIPNCASLSAAVVLSTR